MTQDEDLVTKEVCDYLEKVIQHLEIKQYTIKIAPGTIRGDNYLGIIAKVTVRGKDKSDNDIILNLIVKSAPRGGVFRNYTPIHSAYDREIYIYKKVLPEFTKIQEERAILDPFKSFAKYYGSTMGNLNEALVMEDMKQIGFELHDRHHPLDYNQVLLVLREYGKLHAMSYVLRDQKPELFEELSKNTQEEFFTAMINNMKDVENALKEHTNKALHSLDPIKDKVAYERFEAFRDNMLDLVPKAISSEPAGQYAVIGHGDCWVNNMLFKYDNTSGSKVPSEVCLLDWQLARLGSPALDLSYFIFTCTDKEFRDKHYDNLIKEYYKSLTSHIRKFGSDPEKLFPFTVLQEHLKEFSLYGLYMAVSVLFVMTSEVDEIPDIHNIDEMDEAMKKFQYDSKNVDKYNSRVRGIILDFVRLGYKF